MSKKVIVIGNGDFYHIGSIFHRALTQLGHYSSLLDTRVYAPRVSLPIRAYQKIVSASRDSSKLNEAAQRLVEAIRPNLIIITGLTGIKASTIKEFKTISNAIVVNYATDDPFNPAHVAQTDIEAIPEYDIYFATKKAIINDLKQAGCRQVHFIRFGYDPNLHFPEKGTVQAEHDKYLCDLLFIGGGDKDRFPLIEELLKIKLRTNIYGGFWDQKKRLKPYYKGFVYGRSYRLAIGHAGITLCLVRKANRDGHVMRTFELPACQGFSLVERTVEHLEIFDEDKDAVFFDTTQELIDKILYYTQHAELRERIALSGYNRIVNDPNTYSDRVVEMLKAVN